MDIGHEPGAGRQMFVDAYSGAVLGEGNGVHLQNRPRVAERYLCEAHLVKARTYMSEWKTISIALTRADSSRVALTIDTGDGGQPHKRATLTLNRRTGEVERWEPYSSQSAGRRARTWLRFAHTGEVYGVIGQTVAGTATAGAVVVWTGIALALRRFLVSRKRLRDTMPKAA